MASVMRQEKLYGPTPSKRSESAAYEGLTLEDDDLFPINRGDQYRDLRLKLSRTFRSQGGKIFLFSEDQSSCAKIVLRPTCETETCLP
jgi:hypothetical protein